MTSGLKVSTCITTNITSRSFGLIEILVVMSVSTLETAVIIYVNVQVIY